jgi:serine protease Do
MNQVTHPSARARRIRNALLASVFTLGIVGAAGTSAFLTDSLSSSHLARAEQVKVEAPGPTDFTAVVAEVAPAVVSVQVKTEVAAVANRMMEGLDNLPPGMEEFFRRFGIPREFGDNEGDNGAKPYQPRRGISQGSGFFISQDGYLVTNAHVVQDGTEYTVIMDDGRELDAKLIGTDDRTDLALLKVDGNDFTFVAFAKEAPKVGQWVLAMGNPFGLGGSVSAGIISAEHRDIGSGPYDNYLQIDAPVNRGNSGGPAFNTQGEVVGVNTAIFSPSGGSVGIAFAIPAGIVSNVVGDLRDDGAVTRGWLGVQIQPVTKDIAESLGIDDTEGAIVAEALASGPAKGAGVRAGDIITKVNGEAISGPKELSQMIAGMDPGEKITVTVLRDGTSRDIDVTLGDLNQFDEQQQASADEKSQDNGKSAQPGSLEDLGLTLEANPDGEGVLVSSVKDGSPAAERGIQAGSVIVEVGGEAVSGPADVEKAIAAARDRGRDAVLLRVQSKDGTHFVGVPIERG